ncbi:MAG TPA: NAD(P)-binding domain-containing protein [Candidatus Limnocylindrales bacterium]|nr:NAD(P)-binding domain-containing protein [Candidatus Limnocylindrales bacterium]
MRIAILGAGNVGGALGAAFASVGHEVVFGVRDPASDKTRTALAGAPGSTAAAPRDAVCDADVVCFALRWDAIPETIAQLPSLDGRVVIDAMNRFGGDPARSTTQDLADLLPGARLAKAFNTTGFENMTTARDRRTKVAMFVAGDDPDAKRVAMELAGEIGFQPEDAGPLANVKALEEMVRVWLALTKAHGRTVGFALSED